MLYVFKARTKIILFLILACCSSVVAQGSSDTEGYKKFQGAWFDILYPKDFQPRMSMLSKSSGERKSESAFFRSPDGEVEFYIYSPQWSGEPRDIALNPSSEIMGDKSVSTKNGETTTMYTIKAKDGSYMRSYREISTESTRHVIGIKYKNKAAHTKYRTKYVKFRDSLHQYADGWDGEQ